MIISLLMMSYSFRICGTYEQLAYWPNGFDDFYVGKNRLMSEVLYLYFVVINCDTLSYNDCKSMVCLCKWISCCDKFKVKI
jgi:hypothetical protein